MVSLTKKHKQHRRTINMTLTSKQIKFIICCAIIALSMYVMIGYKQSTELLIKQSPLGTLSCV